MPAASKTSDDEKPGEGENSKSTEDSTSPPPPTRPSPPESVIVPIEKEPSYRVIREVYDNGVAFEKFEAELEKALEAQVDYIVIEPTRLGDETGRWIYVGNCLHKTAVISGITAIVSGLVWQDRPMFSTPLCVISVFCTGLYTVSWNYDPCCQYQVVKRPPNNLKIPVADLSPVILAYTRNTKAKYLHRFVTLASAVFCGWQIYKTFK